MPIPTHTAEGWLPIGEHNATWTEFVDRFGFSPRRRAMLKACRGAFVLLADAGCEQVLVGGSFVTTKVDPGDVDVVWDVAGVDIDVLPEFFQHAGGLQMLMEAFAIHCFPSMLREQASGLMFREFFQIDKRTGEVVGVVLLDLNTI